MPRRSPLGASQWPNRTGFGDHLLLGASPWPNRTPSVAVLGLVLFAGADAGCSSDAERPVLFAHADTGRSPATEPLVLFAGADAERNPATKPLVLFADAGAQCPTTAEDPSRPRHPPTPRHRRRALPRTGARTGAALAPSTRGPG